MHRSLYQLAVALFQINAVKFGAFKLKLHENQPDAPLSPIFFNLRTNENPKPGPLRESDVQQIVTAMSTIILDKKLDFDGMCGIPNAGRPFAKGFIRMLGHRLQLVELLKIENDDRRWIDHVANRGGLHRGACVILIDDVVTGADTKLEAIRMLRDAGFVVDDLIVVVDHEQGGTRIVEAEGVHVHSIFSLSDLLDFYLSKGWISTVMYENVKQYIASFAS